MHFGATVFLLEKINLHLRCDTVLISHRYKLPKFDQIVVLESLWNKPPYRSTVEEEHIVLQGGLQIYALREHVLYCDNCNMAYMDRFC